MFLCLFVFVFVCFVFDCLFLRFIEAIGVQKCAALM